MSPYAHYLVESLATLLAVVALSVTVLALARRLGVGRPRGPMALVGSLPVDARRSVHLIRIGRRVLVVGAGEGGLRRLGELDASDIEEDMVRADGFSSEARPFERILRHAFQRPEQGTDDVVRPHSGDGSRTTDKELS